MQTVPNTVPPVVPQPSQPVPLTVAPDSVPASGEDGVSFKVQGRTYRLYKRFDGKDAPYYVRFEHQGKTYKRSLDTNVRSVAMKNARTFIEKVRAERWDDVARMRARCVQSAASLAQIEPLYRKYANIGYLENNLWAMGKVLKTGLDIEDWLKTSLNEVNALLVTKFQNAMVKEYCDKADKDDESQRAARELALRSSKSILRQARSLFNRQKALVELYREQGLLIPDHVRGTETMPGFCNCKVLGKNTKSQYLAPPDAVVEKAFTDIMELKTADPLAYIAFWLAAGAGLRRSEIGRCRWEYLVERDGMLWISGGIGKDGERIEVPVQPRAVAALADLRQASGPVMGSQKSLDFAKRLNYWMKHHGWQDTEKKMHELRAYVGSLIYRQNPNAAMRFMRHKTIRMTEQFYVRYGANSQIPHVL